MCARSREGQVAEAGCARGRMAEGQAQGDSGRVRVGEWPVAGLDGEALPEERARGGVLPLPRLEQRPGHEGGRARLAADRAEQREKGGKAEAEAEEAEEGA